MAEDDISISRILDFKSVIAFRQLHNHPNAFCRSDIYAVCRLSPLTFDLAPCKHEVAFCAWMRVDEFVVHEQTTAFGRSVGRLLMHGLERGFSAVDVTSHELEYAQPQARAKSYKLFHRPLPCETP
ncbi:PREDICTED: nucleoside diphosphate-linked moiety X motif 6-like [Priapulus caudatus]|uniref:Nucleoside diphosphate-linked moiety X motif 6-like n=1 Tax=Priapulus caudatus TaxID=37621 RepID=A0ABM1ESK8_PRICU|nr:PREDICTED: nucleoside diphosphate-linked moiety X motif 6-like [Priapulus caudatus]